MWFWSTIFGLGGELSRSALRGVRLLLALGLGFLLLGGLGASLIARHPEKAAAAAVGAISIDSDASLHDNARYAAESYRDAHGMMIGAGRESGDVAAEWERDRKEAEASEAAWYED
jgi:hypothetical protein